MVLGASRGEIVRLVVGRGFVLALAGSITGVLGGLAASRLLESRIHGISSHRGRSACPKARRRTPRTGLSPSRSKWKFRAREPRACSSLKAGASAAGDSCSWRASPSSPTPSPISPSTSIASPRARSAAPESTRFTSTSSTTAPATAGAARARSRWMANRWPRTRSRTPSPSASRSTRRSTLPRTPAPRWSRTTWRTCRSSSPPFSTKW